LAAQHLFVLFSFLFNFFRLFMGYVIIGATFEAFSYVFPQGLAWNSPI